MGVPFADEGPATLRGGEGFVDAALFPRFGGAKAGWTMTCPRSRAVSYDNRARLISEKADQRSAGLDKPALERLDG